MSLEYEPYLFADPVFFDLLGRRHDPDGGFEATGLPAPEGWQRDERDPWISLHPAGEQLPEQGWKVHVTAQPSNAARIVRTVWDYCVDQRLAFKFLRNRHVLLAHSSKYAPRTGSGKFITIYPPDEPALHRLLTELDERLAGEAGPNILSDLRWGAGPLFTRFGAFVDRHYIGEDGDIAYAITGPDGALHPDRRRPVFAYPSWVELPDFLVPHREARRTGAGGQLPYQVSRALHFSNGGGVYLATRRTDGRQVVLKEARPLAGLDSNGWDAVRRLRQERWALRRLSGVPGVPAYHDYLTAGEHEFLVEEYVEGQTLQAWLATNYPLVATADPAPDRIAGYTGRALRIHAELGELVGRLHARDVVFGDLQPTNVVVRPDGSLCLLDFELAHATGDEQVPGLQTPGFADLRLRGEARDRYALAALGLWLFLPLNGVLTLDPERTGEYLAFVAERFAPPAGFLASLRQALDRSPLPGPASGGARLVVRLDERSVDWGVARRSMAAAILLSATPDREDRLFPGDARQFSEDALGFAHGAGGVLWALSVTGHGRYPEHEQWWRRAIGRTEPRRPGFYDGLHGFAYLADHFGWHDEATRLLDRAIDGHAVVRAVDLYRGLAGAGLNLLHFGDRTGDRQFVDEARAVAKRIAEALELAGSDHPALPSRGRAGLLRGWSGPALFLARLAEATGEAGYLDLARRAIHRDLDLCVTVVDGDLQVDDGIRTLCYLDTGSAGIALVADELLSQCADDRLAESVPRLVRACGTEFVIQSDLFNGRAGLLATLSRLGPRLATDPGPPLVRHLRRLGWHAVSYRGHLAFPGSHLLRLSMDLATGTAGVLLAVHAATVDHAGFLPFFHPRKAWGPSGEDPATH
jgi:class III lanthionine synthetase